MRNELIYYRRKSPGQIDIKHSTALTWLIHLKIAAGLQVVSYSVYKFISEKGKYTNLQECVNIFRHFLIVAFKQLDGVFEWLKHGICHS